MKSLISFTCCASIIHSLKNLRSLQSFELRKASLRPFDSWTYGDKRLGLVLKLVKPRGWDFTTALPNVKEVKYSPIVAAMALNN